MMTTENLWGELPEIEETRTPYNILVQEGINFQATFFLTTRIGYKQG